jgi:integrase/recombinase XerD
MKPTISIVLDSRNEKKSGKYPVKLRVTYNRQQKYYSIWVDLTKQDFHYIQNPNEVPKGTDSAQKRRFKAIKQSIDKEYFKACDIAEKMPDFGFRQFEKQYLQNKPAIKDIFGYYTTTIETLRQSGKVGTASNYQSSMNSIKFFSKKLTFNDITPEFLKEYEFWLVSEGKSITTVGIYLRPLRSLINQAISDEVIPQDRYPFGKRKYQIPSGKNIKKALLADEIGRIYNYSGPAGTWFQKARDFFIFSYLANGMNMKDIALLQNCNLDGEFIRYNRAKTINTNRSGNKPISVPVTPEILAIIERWKGKGDSQEDFVFPILEKGLTPDRQRSLIQQFTKMVNRYIGIVAKEVGINKPVTTYYARHSFATILKRGGASTDFISESLGHSSLKTTNSYLGSFDDETKKQMQLILTMFKA